MRACANAARPLQRSISKCRSARATGSRRSPFSVCAWSSCGARNRQQAKPILGLRLLELRLASLSVAGSDHWRSRTLLDVPLMRRDDDPLRDTPSSNLLGKAVIVGIVVGAVIAVNVLNDDDDDGGGY